MGDIFAARNRRIIPVLLGVVILHVCALAQELTPAKPEALGLSS
ncbi:MAG TPA: hypothetical protein VFL34_15780 [Candidatus Sulfotelmatobacter sp.]|nr:hypothetical protein [Candidatus Sulfotelmatobacter sp.]